MCPRPSRTAGRAAWPSHRDESHGPLLLPVLYDFGRRVCPTFLLAVSLLVGCGGATMRRTGEAVPYADAPLLAAEIRRAGPEHLVGQTAYDVVRLLRPGFLEVAGFGARGRVELPETAVYVNGSRVGGLEALRSIPQQSVAVIRLVKPLDAVTAFGRDHGAGAIVVELVR